MSSLRVILIEGLLCLAAVFEICLTTLGMSRLQTERDGLSIYVSYVLLSSKHLV